MPLTVTDDLGRWTQLGFVTCIPWNWQRTPEQSEYANGLLLRLTPLFSVPDFQGYFWVRLEHFSPTAVNSVLRSERYYPERDAKPTLFEPNVPIYIQQTQPFWLKRVELMYVPGRGTKILDPTVKVEETGIL
ncbi:hypothetical protein HC928_11285 [bacterium]|nr:hypothetical protein [bacterium]